MPDGGIEWQGSRNSQGYGRSWVPVPGNPKGTFVGAHRTTWERHFGPIPEGMLVCHMCDNPPCVNPEHLFLGTNQDNQRDASRKGRSGKGRPCQLDPRDRPHIVSLYRDGFLREHLAESFGISPALVSILCRAAGLTDGRSRNGKGARDKDGRFV
jgi:hypothetical protein